MHSKYFIFLTNLLILALAQANSNPKLKFNWDPSCPSTPSLNACYITINSDDEKKIFQKNLKSNPETKCAYKHIELTDSITQANKNNWFEDVCSTGVQCDVLVISGHFAGEFIGSNIIPGINDSTNLPMSTILNQSCQKTCDGILKNPSKVYLFGCNTLSGKEADNRSNIETKFSKEQIAKLPDPLCRDIYQNKKISSNSRTNDMIKYRCDLKYLDYFSTEQAELTAKIRYSDIGHPFEQLSK